MKPNTLIIRTAGTNCDAELAHAFAQAGAEVQSIHLSELIDNPAIIERFEIIGFPGGFSYGDDISAGRIYANRLRHRLLKPLQAAVNRGVPMIGICNGFQVMVKLGLLPDPTVAVQTATLTDNATGRFTCRWVGVEAEPASCCIWTRGLERFELPIANGEGRFTATPELIEQLKANDQIALRYDLVCDEKSNGSDDAIAGICDPTGIIFGLMPHPERYTTATQHPQWTRQGKDFLEQTMPGLRFFENAVEYAIAKGAAVVSEC